MPINNMLQSEILYDSFSKIELNIQNFATSFYDNLFIMYPKTKPLFASTNMEAQKQKLIDSLKAILVNIRYGDSLALLLRGLGARHVKYGALPEHYPAIGNALLETLGQYLKEEWTPSVKQAWVEAYDAITTLMLEGANYSPEDVSLTSENLSSPRDLSVEIAEDNNDQPEIDSIVSEDTTQQNIIPVTREKKDYKNLKVWQKAIKISQECYCLIHKFSAPQSDILIQNILKVSVSIPAHIADGYGRKNTEDYLLFFDRVLGLINKLETYLIISIEVKLFYESDVTSIMNLLKEERKMIVGIIKKLP